MGIERKEPMVFEILFEDRAEWEDTQEALNCAYEYLTGEGDERANLIRYLSLQMYKENDLS